MKNKTISIKQTTLNTLLREEDDLKDKIKSLRKKINPMIKELKPHKNYLHYPRVLKELSK